MPELLAFRPSPVLFTQVERTGPASLRRLVTVQPGMCGPLQSLAACVGDWTWETVGSVCGLDVAKARDDRGTPSYLAFYYFRILSEGRLGVRDLTFGDRLEVQSRVFQAGRLSVLTVHRIRHIAENLSTPDDVPFGATEAYTAPRPDSLYVENLNTWVTRRHTSSNVGLLRRAPVGFRHDHLPTLPAAFSPGDLCAQARSAHVFADPARTGWVPTLPDTEADHEIDVVRDVNGVGLLYFASLFSIAERAVHQVWRSRGRSGRSFLERTLNDARLCYVGNADLDATLRVRMRTSHDPHDPAHEKTDVVIRDLSTDRTIALGAFRHRG
jgi:probable biosynthetic protein (TIGR04098 family)